ncbi:hypothetical protein HPB50_023546 [Hyalomma asiaticum]|uniref:Uncharacterized protein n=1 Tax=Hyalomma asiaticum TaxID=266040 RepID=A0ACB7TNJ2_HYAAI|nr:hypothetical protein HPB50_023546 [Hyalomma asiaticum]
MTVNKMTIMIIAEASRNVLNRYFETRTVKMKRVAFAVMMGVTEGVLRLSRDKGGRGIPVLGIMRPYSMLDEPRDLDELASEAKRIQANILASRAYRPPPPASQALEPRCAWNGDNFRTRPQGNGLLAFSDERSSSGWELSDRALDPYTYARRAACAADGRDDPARTHSLARQPLGPVHIARASSAPCQYARQRSFPQGEEALVPRHTTIGPSRKANGRSFEHHQTPAAPNVSRAQYQLSDSSSSSPGTPPWPATADDSATTGRGGKRQPPLRHNVLDSVVDTCPSVSPR